MGNLEGYISQVTGKLQTLIKKYQILEKENERLKAELAIKTNSETALQTKLKLQQQQLEIMQIATSGDGDEQSKTQLEKRLNNYIKEIDQCISLLTEQ